MRWILTVWQKKHLDDEWQKAIEAFDAVSIKIADGKRGFFRRGEAQEVIRATKEKGVSAHGWGYHYCRTTQEAREEGTAAGKAAFALDVSAYHLNLEKHWAGIWGAPKTADPERAALAFIDSFKNASHNSIPIAWNGFSIEKKWRGRRFCTENVIRNCDAWIPMCYGSIHRRVKRSRKWTDRGIDIQQGAMIASGRLNRSGKPTLTQEGKRSLDTFLLQAKPDVVAIWYGAGAKGMLTQGNAHNAPWPQYIKENNCAMVQS